MSRSIAIPIVCSCKENKKFKYTVQLADKQHETASTSIQIDCPFSHEDNCVKHLTIQLPPGVQPKNDENIFRGE